jgi:hypothetical protein
MILELIKYISIFNFEQIIYEQNPTTYLMHRPTFISLVGILASHIHSTNIRNLLGLAHAIHSSSLIKSDIVALYA